MLKREHSRRQEEQEVKCRKTAYECVFQTEIPFRGLSSTFSGTSGFSGTFFETALKNRILLLLFVYLDQAEAHY